MLHAWKKKYGSAAVVRRERGGETPEDELKRLRREDAQLRQERDVLKISGRLRQGPLVSPYELVDSEKAAFPVSVLCAAVGVSRSAY